MLGICLWLGATFLVMMPLATLKERTWRRIADPLTAGPGRNTVAAVAVGLECFVLGTTFHFAAVATLMWLGLLA